MSKENKNDEKYGNETYFAMALDPIHIGTGGYRLGRVDNTIVREPGTNVPKIPGTTLKGASRLYASYTNEVGNDNCVSGKKGLCGSCDICLIFGYTNYETKNGTKSMHGLIQLSDLRILLFPVYSIVGPVWITSPRILKNICNKEINIENDKIKTDVVKKSENLNLGWLYLENESEFPDIGDSLKDISEDIRNSLVLVSDRVFSQIVNSNLEVRTSIAIDPKTGSVEEGALFTFEAIPRTTIFYFDVIVNNPNHFDIPQKWKDNKNINEIYKIFESTFPYFEIIGMGGMSTKGFGRIRMFKNSHKKNKGD